jgi:polar amino acid transport system substrate-binding protein/arginine/ornithine transport system substrate-binding protein
MRFKKLTTALALGVFALGLGTAQADEKLRIGVEGAYPPFSWKEADGTLKGFDIDIAVALCEKMGRECDLVEQDWDGIIPALLAKKYDAIIASMSITEERKKRVDFTGKYYNTPARFVAAKDADFDATTEGLKGKVVGVQRGTTHQCYMEKMFPDTELKLYGTQEEVFLDLGAGRIDAQINSIWNATVKAPGSQCAKARTTCAIPSTRRLRRSVTTALTRRSTPSTSTSTFTGLGPDPSGLPVRPARVSRPHR